jgi:hypothetical protein
LTASLPHPACRKPPPRGVLTRALPPASRPPLSSRPRSKFVAFQLTVNISALVVAFVGAIVGGHEPLTVLQLLWVNL